MCFKKNLERNTDEFFHEKQSWVIISNIHESSTKVLLMIPNMQLVLLHVVVFSAKLAKKKINNDNKP